MRRQFRSRRQVGSQHRADKRRRESHLAIESLEERVLMAAGLNEFGHLSYNAGPFAIVAGPDGNLWFTEANANQIGRLAPDGGTPTEFPLPTAGSLPQGITTGPDGNLWFTEANANRIGTITPDGRVTEYPIPTTDSRPQSIVTGPDANLWFTETAGNRIGSIAPDGTVTEFSLPTDNSQPLAICLGPDGNLWFTETNANRIGTITPDGVVTEFALPVPGSQPSWIAAGPDGNLWFTETSANRIGTITTDGQVTGEVPLPTPGSQPFGIVAGPDQSVWFTEPAAGQVGRITPDGGVTEYATPTPGSQPTGITLGPDNDLWFTEAAAGQIGQAVPNASLSAVALAPAALEGALFHGEVATFMDTARTGGQASDYTATIAWGDGTTSTGLVLPRLIDYGPGRPKFDVLGTHTYADEGNYAVTVRLTYADGGSPVVVHAVAAVADAPLTMQGTSLAVVEGGAFHGAVASFTDANPMARAAEFTATIDWGDHQTSPGTVQVNNDGSFLVVGDHVYADEGSYQVRVTVLDVGGSTATVLTTAAIADAPLTATSATMRGVEGTAVSGVLASFTDANPNAQAGEFTATIRWGDGQTSAGTVTANGRGGFDISGTHPYVDPGPYTIAITIADVGGSSATATTPATIADAPLTARGLTLDLVEGTAFTGVVATFTDANPSAVAGDFSVTITWADGSTSPGTITRGDGDFTVSGSHTYAHDGAYAVAVVITDHGGSQATAAGSARVADAALTATGASLNLVEAASFTGVVASFRDANPSGTAADFSATIAWGDGSTSAGTVSAGASGGFNVSGSHAYAEEGNYAITVTITDRGGSRATGAGVANVADAPLTATSATLTTIEGTAFTGVVATFTDANPNGTLSDFSATIAWGDGNTSPGIIAVRTGGGFSITGSHTYARDGSYAVGVSASDKGGSRTTAASTATVTDAALTATGISLSSVEGTAFNGMVASFRDGNALATAGDFIVSIGWGDGTSSAGTVTATGSGGFDITGSHTYADEGSYTVAVTITDRGGSRAIAASTARVADAPLTATSSAYLDTHAVSLSDVLASFTDGNSKAAAQEFTATIVWGDGHTSNGTIKANDHGGFDVSGANNYAGDGPYTITVTVRDAGGSSASTRSVAGGYYFELLHRYQDGNFGYRDRYGFVVSHSVDNTGRVSGDDEQGDALHVTGLATAAAALHGDNQGTQDLLRTLRDQPFITEGGRLRLIRHPDVWDYVRSGNQYVRDRHSPVTKDGIVGVMAGLYYAYSAAGMSTETKALAKDVMQKYIDYLVANSWMTIDRYPDNYWAKNGDNFANVFSNANGDPVTWKGPEGYMLSPSDRYALRNVAAKMGFETSSWSPWAGFGATLARVLGDGLAAGVRHTGEMFANLVGKGVNWLLDKVNLPIGYSFKLGGGVLPEYTIAGGWELKLAQADRDNIVNFVKGLVQNVFNTIADTVDKVSDWPARLFQGLDLTGRIVDKVLGFLPSGFAQDQLRPALTSAVQQIMPWLNSGAVGELVAFGLAHQLAKQKSDVAHLTFWPTLLEFETRPEIADLLNVSVNDLSAYLGTDHQFHQQFLPENDDFHVPNLYRMDMALFGWLNGDHNKTDWWLYKFETDARFGNVSYAWKVDHSQNVVWVLNTDPAKPQRRTKPTDWQVETGRHRLDYLLLKGLNDRGTPRTLSSIGSDWLSHWGDVIQNNVIDALKKDFSKLAGLLKGLGASIINVAKILQSNLHASIPDITNALWNGFTHTLNDIAQALKAAGATFDQIVSNLWDRAAHSLNDMAKALSAAGASDLGTIAVTLWNNNLSHDVGAIAVALRGVLNNFAEIAKGLYRIGPVQVPDVARGLWSLTHDLGDIAVAIWNSNVSQNVGAIALALQGVLNNFTEIARGLYRIGPVYAPQVVQGLWALTHDLGNIAVAIWDGNVSHDVGVIAQALQGVYNNFTEIARGLYRIGPVYAPHVAQGLWALTHDLGNIAVAIWDSNVSRDVGVIAQALQGVYNNLTEIARGLYRIGPVQIQDAARGLRRLTDNLANIARALHDGIDSGLGRIAYGLYHGITTSLGDVSNALWHMGIGGYHVNDMANALWYGIGGLDIADVARGIRDGISLGDFDVAWALWHGIGGLNLGNIVYALLHSFSISLDRAWQIAWSL